MKKWLMLFVVALFVLVLSACTATKDAGEKKETNTGNEGEEKETAVETETEKILKLNNGNEPTSFDPSVGFDAVSWNALNNLMEGLVRLSKDHVAEPATAEKIDVTEDGLTYTFTIRDDAKWSNGEPVLASDFVYGWLHMLNPETASPAAFLAYFIDGAEAYNSGEGAAEDVAIKAVEEKVFEVKLNAPTEAFLNIITNPSFFPA